MFINITIKTNENSKDIRIDSNQKIGSALFVLRQSGKLANGSSPDYYHSRINRQPVSAYKTFAEENIYDGDILSAVLI